MKLRPLNKFWVCIDRHGNVDFNTIAGFKHISVERFMEDTRETDTWTLYRKKYGWNCKKVNIQFILVDDRKNNRKD